jgi:hypothetical protein
MFCQKCAQELPPDSSFCVGCGDQTGPLTASSGTTPSTARKRSKSKKIVPIVAVACVAIVLAGYFFMSSKKGERLASAVDTCSVGGYANLSEDHKSLVYDGSSSDDYVSLKCLLSTLNAPSTVWERMTRTTALMGAIDDEWDGITISWTYHPDNGLDCYFEISS